MIHKRQIEGVLRAVKLARILDEAGAVARWTLEALAKDPRRVGSLSVHTVRSLQSLSRTMIAEGFEEEGRTVGYLLADRFEDLSQLEVETCVTCAGRSWILSADERTADGHRVMRRCPTCNGTGLVSREVA